MSPAPTIGCVIVDALDAEALARFWSAVLARPVIARTGPFVWLERVDGLGVGFQQVDAVPARKNRIHLDLAADDPRAERSRIEALGGRFLPEYAAGGFLVLADPEGNEFCVIPRGPFDVDDDGHADYLDGAADPTG